ncbi:unnamed protein product [Ambrosiozyma monospora]|uniref:Unnamed protein product n=1 Tax=Ambrosiozyma monospora TaxID=43982 RepID=A0A9W6YZ92_AMBMO|nr:unnamed protein product [Ambrosiozyma monospora]
MGSRRCDRMAFSLERKRYGKVILRAVKFLIPETVGLVTRKFKSLNVVGCVRRAMIFGRLYLLMEGKKDGISLVDLLIVVDVILKLEESIDYVGDRNILEWAGDSRNTEDIFVNADVVFIRFEKGFKGIRWMENWYLGTSNIP